MSGKSGHHCHRYYVNDSPERGSLTRREPESSVPRMPNFKIADPKLADAGRLRIEWAESRMPVLLHLRDKGKRDLPLRGMKVAGCLHVTKETAVLISTIR